jgi:CRP-like cAMP-binding protein
MKTGVLGKAYLDGEVIIRQGDKGTSMYVVQDGYVEVVKEIDGQHSRLAVLGKGDFFGEMAIFEHEIRMATVRALGPALILTIDQKNFLRRIHEDPSLAYRLVQVMSSRLRKLAEEVTMLRIYLIEHGLPPGTQAQDIRRISEGDEYTSTDQLDDQALSQEDRDEIP